jgi:uncharacterized protein YcaQ
MGPYDVDLVRRASETRPRRMVEYWAHVQAYMPVDLWPVMRHRMTRLDQTYPLQRPAIAMPRNANAKEALRVDQAAVKVMRLAGFGHLRPRLAAGEHQQPATWRGSRKMRRQAERRLGAGHCRVEHPSAEHSRVHAARRGRATLMPAKIAMAPMN